MDVLVVSQSVIAPLVLASVMGLLNLGKERYQTLGFLLIWLGLYIWVKGVPDFLPTEAIDWLPYLLIIQLLWSFIESWKWRTVLSVFTTGIGFILFAWPVLKYQADIVTYIAIGLSLLSIIALLLLKEVRSPSQPVVVLAISSGFVAVGSLLGGSILIAQLASVLAFVLTGFSIQDFRKRNKIEKEERQYRFLNLAVMVYYSLLLIGHLYSEPPVLMTMMLILSPIIGFALKGKIGWTVFFITIIAAIASVYDRAMVSGY